MFFLLVNLKNLFSMWYVFCFLLEVLDGLFGG